VPSSGKGHTVKSCRVRQKSTCRGCRGCGGRFLAELAPPGAPLPSHNRLYEEPYLAIRAHTQSTLTRYLLNLREVLVTHTNGLGGPEVPMTKHRTITGFVAVTLLAAAASVATMRAPSTGRAIGSPDVASLKILTTDENQLQAREFENQPLGTKSLTDTKR